MMHRKKSLSIAAGLLVVVILSTACAVIGGIGGGGQAAPQPAAAEAVPTVDLGQPDGVAQTFLTAWERGDYQGMYSLLGSNSQASYSLQDFMQWYENTANTMTLISLTATPNSALTQGNSAQVTFHVRYETHAVGIIERDLTMLLTYNDQSGRWGVVWSPALIFEGLCNTCVLSLEAETPARANIYDRNGLWLAQEDAAAVTIAIVPQDINENFEQQMLEQLSPILRQSVDGIKQQYDGLPVDWEIALGDTDLDTYNENRGVIGSYSALRVYEKTGRRYYNALAPHVLGYVSFIPGEECTEWQQRGYNCDDLVGISGLENWGEQYLAGRGSGRLSIFTSTGEFVTDIATIQPVPSQSLYTTIDRQLQAIVQDALLEAYYAGRDTWAGGQFPSPGAAVVVLDVNNGDILAMASYPGYDPNVFHPVNQYPQAESRIQAYLNDYRKPLLNRATQGEYPPGSVFKVVSMAAAMGEGGYSTDTTYNCLGFWDGLGVQDRKLDWLEGGHGVITLAQALTFSCDSYFYQVGLDTGNQNFDMIPHYARGFGLGAPTGLEQLEESPGLIPDTAWMAQTRGRDWTISDSVNIAIGQGDVLVTPLQAANMMAAIANGGTLYRPQLVHQIALIGEEPSWTSEPEVIGTLPVSPENLAVMEQSLWNVSRDLGGTAHHILQGANMAGKTGTAQAPGETAFPHAWFVGYAPADDPQIAVAVVIENGGQGADIAAPVFKRIVDQYLFGGYDDFPSYWYDPEEYEQYTETIRID